MSPMQKFVINSEQSVLAKRHRRNVFKAKIKAKIKPALQLMFVFAFVLVGLMIGGSVQP